MKKYLLILSLFGFCFSVRPLAQNIRVPNSSFEIWDSLATLTVPDSWPSSDLLWYYNGYSTHNVAPDRHCRSGKYSARIKPDTAAGKLWPGFIASKFAINKLPAYCSFYYVDSLNQTESGAVKINFFSWNIANKTEDSIGGLTWNFPGNINKDFALGNVPIDYSLIDTTVKPDSISITFEVVSSPGSLPSGYIAVDDVSLGSDTAGIEIPALTQDFEVFPNPSNSVIHLVSQNFVRNDSKVEIVDVNGQTIYSQYQNIGDLSQIDLSQYPIGLYFVKITFGDKTQ